MNVIEHLARMLAGDRTQLLHYIEGTEGMLRDVHVTPKEGCDVCEFRGRARVIAVELRRMIDLGERAWGAASGYTGEGET